MIWHGRVKPAGAGCKKGRPRRLEFRGGWTFASVITSDWSDFLRFDFFCNRPLVKHI